MPEIHRELPPYLQVVGHIRNQIVRGELSPGDRVPSAREIATTWGVARATADKVLQVLRAQGLVESRPGAGTTVLGNPPIYRSAHDRDATARRTGRIYTKGEHAKIVSAEEVPAPDDVAAQLQVAPGTPVVRRHRVTYLHEAPLSASTSWFTAEVGTAAPRLLIADRILEGTTRYVEQATGRAVRYSQERVAARLATPAEATELNLPTPLAVLETRRTAWDEHDQPLTYEIGLAQPGYEMTFTYTAEEN